MISFASTWALIVRHLRVWQRDPNLILAGISWPLLDIIIWGFLGSWIEQSGATQFKNYELTALMGVLLWQIVSRGSIITVSTFTEELWSYNLINIFSLPLRITEWMLGAALFSALMVTIVSTVCILYMLFAYTLSTWDVLSTVLIFAPPLFISSLWIGFSCLQIVITLGKRGIELSFVLAWFLAPFCGAYYPIEVLPHWTQTLSSFIPMSYVFKGMRGYLMEQKDPTHNLMIGYVLSILYATLAIMLFIYCFNRSKQKGLSRLAD